MIYLFLMLLVFFLGGGGLKTVLYIFTALSFAIFFFWENFLADSREVISRWARSAFLALIFFMGLSYWYSSTPNVGLNDFIVVMYGLLIFTVSTTYFKSKKKILVFYRGVTLLSILVFLFGAYIYVFYPFNRFSGPFVDLNSFNGFFPNAWIDFVIMVFPFTLFLLYERTFVTNLVDRVLGGVAMIFLLSGSFLSYSRGGWLCFLLMLAIIGGSYLLIQKWQFRVRNFVHSLVGFMGIVLLAMVMVFSLNSARSFQGYEVLSFFNKATLQANEKLASLSEREQFFDGSLKLMKESPILGFGPYSFRYVYPRYQQELLTIADHPHSLAHKIAAESGLISLILFFIFAAIVFAVMRHGLVKYFRKQWIFVLITTGGVSGVIIHNVIDFNLHFLAISLIFWVLMGQLFALVLPVIKSNKVLRHWQWWFGILIISSGIIVGIHEAYYGNFLRAARAVNISDEREVIVQRADLYEKALGMWQPRDLYIDLIRDYIALGKEKDALLLIEKYAPTHQYYAELWYFWGELLRKAGNYELAGGKYLRAINMDPLNELRYYYGYYLNLTAQKNEKALLEWRMKILPILEIYTEKLRNNEHFTVLYSNPTAAHGLYVLLGMPEKAEIIEKLYILEMNKLKYPKNNARQL